MIFDKSTYELHDKKIQYLKNYMFIRDTIVMTYNKSELWVQNVDRPLEIKRLFFENRIACFQKTDIDEDYQYKRIYACLEHGDDYQIACI